MNLPVVKYRKAVVSISKSMSRSFPKNIMELTKKIGRISNSLGYSVFAVGGLVRDLLLGMKNFDLDIVVEGEAITMGKVLAETLNGTLVVHKKFGTCTVVTKKKIKIDLATARKEVYEKPAALPTVEFSSLKDDLIRRDFTINAMAISLNEENFGQLIDFFGGEYDLARGRIRVMHDASFIDDPTRIFRAVRFEQRLGFAIDKHSEELILSAVEDGMVEKVEPQRIRNELILVLQEKAPLKALRRMEGLNELRFLHPKLKLDKRIVKLYGNIDRVCIWYDGSGFHKRPIEKWVMYLMALFCGLNYKDAMSVSNKFVFRRSERLRLLSYIEYGNRITRILESKKSVSPSRIFRILEPLPYETILLIMAGSSSKLLNRRIMDFIKKYNSIRMSVKGNDLKALGLVPGPRYSEILRKILYKKIDGRLKTKNEELKYAKELIK